MKILTLPSNGETIGAGMGDYQFNSSCGSHSVVIKYKGEPPHGDSYHTIEIDEIKFPGFAWAGRFGFSSDGRYFVCGWMEKPYERKTIIIDCQSRRYFVLPISIHNFEIRWPSIAGINSCSDLSYTFEGQEEWGTFDANN